MPRSKVRPTVAAVQFRMVARRTSIPHFSAMQFWFRPSLLSARPRTEIAIPILLQPWYHIQHSKQSSFGLASTFFFPRTVRLLQDFNRLTNTVSMDRIQGLSATLVSSHLAGSRNKHFYAPLDGHCLPGEALNSTHAHCILILFALTRH